MMNNIYLFLKLFFFIVLISVKYILGFKTKFILNILDYFYIYIE